MKNTKVCDTPDCTNMVSGKRKLCSKCQSAKDRRNPGQEQLASSRLLTLNWNRARTRKKK